MRSWHPIPIQPSMSSKARTNLKGPWIAITYTH
jgi:hypothetical protein